MDDNEGVIQALHEFENMTDADKVLTQELENLFVQIAHTGRIQIPWVYLKPVFMFKMDKVMRDFFESSPSRNSNSTEPTNNAEFDVMRQRLLDCIESFASAPFTIQRLCELMVEPKRHYRCSDKFMRGIEKNVLVVSTMSESEEGLTNNIDANHDSTCIPNGPVTNGIITTACPTELESVDRHDSDGGHLQQFSETRYPSQGEMQVHNGSHSNDHREENTPKQGEYTESEKVLTQNSTNKENDFSGSKDSGVRIQEHKCEKDNKLEEKSLDEKTIIKEVCEEKGKYDAAKEEIKESTVEKKKSIDNEEEEKKESLIIDIKENENKEDATTTASDQGEPMEE